MNLRSATVVLIVLLYASSCRKHNSPVVENPNATAINKITGTYNGTYTTWARRVDSGIVRVDTGISASALAVVGVAGDSIKLTAPFLQYMPQQAFRYRADNHYHTSISAPYNVTQYDIYLYPGKDSVYVLVTEANRGYGNGEYFNGRK